MTGADELAALARARARALRALMPGTRGRRRQDLEAGAVALELMAEGVGKLDRAGQSLADAFNEEAEGLAVELCPHCRAGSERTPAYRVQGDGGSMWWHDGEGGAVACLASVALELRERVLERIAAQAQTARGARGRVM